MDTTHHKVAALWTSSVCVSHGLAHLETLQFWVRSPWTSVPLVQAPFLERNFANHQISQAQSSQAGVRIFTDGLVQNDFHGAAIVFDDAHGPCSGAYLGQCSRILILSLQVSVGISPTFWALGIGTGPPLLQTQKWLSKCSRVEMCHATMAAIALST